MEGEGGVKGGSGWAAAVGAWGHGPHPPRVNRKSQPGWGAAAQWRHGLQPSPRVPTTQHRATWFLAHNHLPHRLGRAEVRARGLGLCLIGHTQPKPKQRTRRTEEPQGPNHPQSSPPHPEPHTAPTIHMVGRTGGFSREAECGLRCGAPRARKGREGRQSDNQGGPPPQHPSPHPPPPAAPAPAPDWERTTNLAATWSFPQ